MYDHQSLEKKWQSCWKKEKTFQPDLKKAGKPFYNLMMFPYPSAEGLHVGNMYAFTGADIYGRFMRLKGYDVFEPIGLDGFGIHSENYALKTGRHPFKQAERSQKNFYRQLHAIGNQFAWDNHLETYDPDYYRWTQWIFVQFFKNGLVERKKATLNWCPSCKTVLSDEQVEPKEGKNVCERCKAEVERRETEQWFFKITDYAEKLLDYHGTKWPKTTRQIQTNWIGKSEGATVLWRIKPCQGSDPVVEFGTFTTTIDTIFGVTFIVVSPESPYLEKLVTEEQKKTVDAYLEKVKGKTEVERMEAKEKDGVFTGSYAVSPVNGREVPIWVADYVLMNYGTGVVMGVPAHDRRDLEFARKNKLEIIQVIESKGKSFVYDEVDKHSVKGKIVNSENYTGLSILAGREKITDDLIKEGKAKRTVNYKLRDWCISRQRYWGPPIPMIYCPKCAKEGNSWFTKSNSSGSDPAKDVSLLTKERRQKLAQEMAGWYPEAPKNLPVELPYVEDYQPRGKGQSPLAGVRSFYQAKCPACGAEARRETDVSDTFLDSAWYFLRYPSTDCKDQPFDPKTTKRWLPVGMYIGGQEHACLHLLYARFVTMALHDLGYLDFIEPFKEFFAHGLIIKDGTKMSKSKGNIIVPDDYIGKYGADALRMYLMFLGPITQGGDFRDAGMQGMKRFLSRLYQLAQKSAKKEAKPISKDAGMGSSDVTLSENLIKKLHQTIRKMGTDYGKKKYNTALAALMKLTNVWQAYPESANKDFVGIVARLIAPVAPHLAEEFWLISGGKGSVFAAAWPEFDPELVKESEAEVVIQINGKLRETIKLELAVAGNQEKVLEKVHVSRKVQKHLGGREPKKVIFVPGKLINLVV